MKKLVLITMILLGYQAVIAQSLDQEKMERDLEVAKNILATLMKNDLDVYFDGRNIEADYVEGYGVIFTIPRHFMYFHVPPPKITPPDIRIEGISNGNTFIISGMDDDDSIRENKEALEEVKKAQEEAFRVQQEALEDMQEEMKEYQEQMKGEMEKWSENVAEQNEKFQESMITFLADYADLIGQLKPEDKILIRQESPYEDYNFVFAGSDVFGADAADENSGPGGLSMEVTKKDISSYKGGKISLDEFTDMIEVSSSEPKERRADLEMFANIFKQYYSPRLSKTFFTEGTPSYELLDNFGVIYKINTYSSYMEGTLFHMPVLGEDKVNSEERKETIEKLYPEFEKEVKSFIIDYGRTIKSLKDDDMLILKIRMTQCEDCSIPRTIEVMVKMDVLKQFDQQKLSRDKALAAISVKKDFEG